MRTRARIRHPGFSRNKCSAAPPFEGNETLSCQMAQLIKIFVTQALSPAVFLRRNFDLHTCRSCISQTQIHQNIIPYDNVICQRKPYSFSGQYILFQNNKRPGNTATVSKPPYTFAVPALAIILGSNRIPQNLAGYFLPPLFL